MEEEGWTRVAAYVLVRDDDGRILLCRNSAQIIGYEGWWTMPGGKIEWGEHPVDAAERELEEETGLIGDIGSVVGIFSHVFTAEEAVSGIPGHVIGIVFEATNLRGELRDEVDGSTDRCEWFTLDEARALARVPVVDYCLGLCD